MAFEETQNLPILWASPSLSLSLDAAETNSTELTPYIRFRPESHSEQVYTGGPMGLQGQLNDLSSDSIPLLLVATLATCLNYLRSSFFELLHSVRSSRFHPHHHPDDGLFDGVGSGLAGLILLAEQIKLNRDLSYRFGDQIEDALGGCSDCVVCLSNLKVGDRVRRLYCLHVFHKECFDGWLNHLNFNCPLCRSPLVSDERASLTRRHVGEDIVSSWLWMR